MAITRRGMIHAGLSVTGLALTGSGLWAQTGAGPVVETVNGRLRGFQERGALAFKNIPYAGPASGPEHRFRGPSPAPSWTGIRDATAYGTISLQPGPPSGSLTQGENCLSLNVWTPAADGRKRPVMFYSHGGGFSSNSANSAWVNGANLAHQNDVVVVCHNHRLGLLGYLYLGQLLGPEYQGNQGMQDIAAALQWVNRNIAAFGGDPDNVLIFGESGGAMKTMYLYTMPSVSSYFAKGSFESGPMPTHLSPDEATETARGVIKALDLSDPRKLLEVPASQLLTAQTAAERRAAAAGGGGMRPAFMPMVDGTIVPENPFGKGAPAISARKPLIVGSTKDEGIFFGLGDPGMFSLDEQSLRQRLGAQLGADAGAWIDQFRKSRPGASPTDLYIAITTAKTFRSGHVKIAEDKFREGTAPVYSYILQYRSPVKVPGTDYPAGALHASDILAVFNNAGPQPGDAPDAIRAPFNDATPARLKTAANMSAMWAAFARNGDPSIPGQPIWEPFTLQGRETMLIDADCQLAMDPESSERKFWQGRPV